MYHSITFEIEGDNDQIAEKSGSNSDMFYTAVRYNTWNNWHLIPTTRPVVAQPTPNYTYVDIPGADGSLDITDYLIGRPTYSDRTGSFDFYVADYNGEKKSWSSVRAQIASVLNGRVMKMFLEDEKENYYYEGRVYLKQWTPDSNFSKVTIEYRLKPYRYKADGKKAGL